MRSELHIERHENELVEWRQAQLMWTGFSPRLASQVASNDRFDLHALIELAERGCPPELAVRILSPLEDRTSEA